MKISTSFVISALAALAVAHGAAAQDARAIQIVSALYGAPDATRPVNFTARLRQTCGEASTDCQAFCTNAFVGRADPISMPFGPRPICRVTYRCGGQETLVTDAEKNDYLLLSCRTRP